MLSIYLSPLALGFAAFRLLLVAAALLGTYLLWRRPRPGMAIALLLALNLACWIAYVYPLERPYALDEGSDRSFNLGMAASVAVGNSPFEHTQIRFPSPEPFWNALVAALALFNPERVPLAYGALTPLSLLVVGLGLYVGLRGDDTAEDRWERVLIVFAVLGLSSLSMHPRPPAPAFWMANFLLKPNHAVALGIVAIISGMSARRTWAVLPMSLLLGLLAWVFLVDWAYVLLGLIAGMLLRPRGERDWRGVSIAFTLSTLIALPYVRHLARGYGPLETHGAATHMWEDPRGLPLAVPTWATLDLGPLLILGVAGVWSLIRRGGPRDRVVLGVVLGAWLLWLVSLPAAAIGVAPEPDELHYYLRFVTALAAGAALAAVARQVEALKGWSIGRGHVLVLAACLPMSFPAYWDPPNMDRYYPTSLVPLRPKVLSDAQWIRENTSPQAVFLAGRSSATWIPALTGRRVLLNEAGKLLPPDHAERKRTERILMTSSDAQLILRTAAGYGISHLAIDEPLRDAYGAVTFGELAQSPVYRTVHVSSACRIVAIEPASSGAP